MAKAPKQRKTFWFVVAVVILGMNILGIVLSEPETEDPWVAPTALDNPYPGEMPFILSKDGVRFTAKGEKLKEMQRVAIQFNKKQIDADALAAAEEFGYLEDVEAMLAKEYSDEEIEDTILASYLTAAVARQEGIVVDEAEVAQLIDEQRRNAEHIPEMAAFFAALDMDADTYFELMAPEYANLLYENALYEKKYDAYLRETLDEVLAKEGIEVSEGQYRDRLAWLTGEYDPDLPQRFREDFEQYRRELVAAARAGEFEWK